MTWIYHSRTRSLFWCLVAVQFLSAKIIFWQGLPVYRKLMDGKKDEATPVEMSFVLLAVSLMQTAYWLAHRLGPRLQFGRHVLFGHLLLWIGELSFVFPTTVAVVAVFDESIEWKLDWWRLLILAVSLFAMFCYKHQLGTLGDAMIATEAGAGEQA